MPTRPTQNPAFAPSAAHHSIFATVPLSSPALSAFFIAAASNLFSLPPPLHSPSPHYHLLLPLLANALSSLYPSSIPQRHSSPICDHNVPQVPALASHIPHLEVLKLSSCALTHYKPQIYSLSGSSSRAAPKPTLTDSVAARMSPAIQHAGRCHASAERCVGATPASTRSSAQIAAMIVARLHSLTRQHRTPLAYDSTAAFARIRRTRASQITSQTNE